VSFLPRIDLSGLPRSRGARWIRVGTLTTGHFVLRGQSGYPGCFRIEWAGRHEWFKADEFLCWREISASVRVRLYKYSLETSVLACVRGPQWNEIDVLVEVRRGVQASGRGARRAQRHRDFVERLAMCS